MHRYKVYHSLQKKKKKNHLIHVDSPKDSKFASDVQDYD